MPESHYDQGKQPGAPVIPIPLADRLPHELISCESWIAWRGGWTWSKEKEKWKISKVPCDWDGITHDMNDTVNHANYTTAMQRIMALRSRLGTYFGIGVVFSGLNGFFCLDCDDDLIGGSSERLLWLAENYPTWGERSISKDGAHLCYFGTASGKETFRWRGSKIEIFGSVGFVAITGNCLDHDPPPMADGTELLDIIRAEREPDLVEKKQQPDKPYVSRTDGTLSPGNDFDLRGSWQEILETHGWSLEKGMWEDGHVTRPGKDGGTSGTIGKCKGKSDEALLHVFSGNAEPFAENGSYGKFRAYAFLNHRGDLSAAAKALAANGYGTKSRSKKSSKNRQSSQNSGNGKPPEPSVVSAADGSKTGVEIILEYYRSTYRPRFKRANTIHCADGRDVPMNEAVAVPTTRLIDALAMATDALAIEGVAIRRALPGFFGKWSKVAWGDLLSELPEEDDAEIGQGEPVAEEFKQLVREALLTEVVLGAVVRGKTEDVTQVERLSLVEWCQRFAKLGRWRSIRSKRCWTKLRDLGDGEVELMIAVRHELFAQLKADKRLCKMGPNKFSRRSESYCVGRPDDNERPGGQRAVILYSDFVADLIKGIPEPDDVPPNDDTIRRSSQDDRPAMAG